MPDSDVKRVFRDGLGIAILGGQVSGNLEILDFDKPGVFDDWRALVDDQAPGLVDRLPLVETPDGGRHLFYRCDEIGGSAKLAMAREPYAKLSGKTSLVIIESKGEGGYVLAPPSPAECHAANRPYKQIAGPVLPEIPRITVAERRTMLRAARSFDEVPSSLGGPAVSPRGSVDLRPGDDYNDRAQWRDILLPHGWRVWRNQGGKYYWTRPGKERDTSATTGGCGAADLFYVFSTSAPPFEADRGYSKFAAFSMLNHGGDYARAARALADVGYGSKAGPQLGTPKEARAAAGEPARADRRLRHYTYAELEADWREAKTSTRITSGIDELDDAIGGGLPVGQVTTILGNTGVGKSELLRQIRKNMAEAGHPVVHVDVELGAKRIVDRDVAQLTDIPSSKLHQPDLTDGQLSSIEDAFSELRALPILTIPCLGAPPIEELATAVDGALVACKNGKATAVFLDSGQRLAAGVGVDDQRIRNQNFWEWAEALAKKSDVAVVVTSEQKRSEKGNTPTPDQMLHSGAESRAIEFTSDIVLGLVEDGTPADMVAGSADASAERSVKILICKVRDGKVGYLGHEIVFAAPCWEMHVRERDDQLAQRIHAVVREAQGPIGAGEIAKKLKIRRQKISYKCREMERAGAVKYDRVGYVIPPRPEPRPDDGQKMASGTGRPARPLSVGRGLFEDSEDIEN